MGTRGNYQRSLINCCQDLSIDFSSWGDDLNLFFCPMTVKNPDIATQEWTSQFSAVFKKKQLGFLFFLTQLHENLKID